MANVTPFEVLDKLAAIVNDVEDVGIVLTRERFVESAVEFVQLFVNLSGDKLPHGWLIVYAGFTQEASDSTQQIIRTLKYTLESIYPYNDKPSGGLTSHEKFRQMLEAVNESFNSHANKTLGLNNSVTNKLLQSEEDFVVRRWGEGVDSKIAHYAVFSLQVTVEIFC